MWAALLVVVMAEHLAVSRAAGLAVTSAVSMALRLVVQKADQLESDMSQDLIIPTDY